MDLADRIYNAVPGLCDWLASMEFNQLCVVCAVVLVLVFFTPFFVRVLRAEYEPFEPEWMDEKLYREANE